MGFGFEYILGLGWLVILFVDMFWSLSPGLSGMSGGVGVVSVSESNIYISGCQYPSIDLYKLFKWKMAAYQRLKWSYYYEECFSLESNVIVAAQVMSVDFTTAAFCW